MNALEKVFTELGAIAVGMAVVGLIKKRERYMEKNGRKKSYMGGEESKICKGQDRTG